MIDELAHFFPDGRLGSLIGGELIEGAGERVDMVDPSTGHVVASYSDGGHEAVDRAVEAAEAGGRDWRALSASERGRALWQVGQEVRRHLEQLARLEAVLAGKPLRDARAEATKVAEMFEYYAGWADKQHGEVIPVPTSHLNYTLREPYGTVAAMTPWNAPLFTAGWQLGPALAAGNAMVLKPSELTPVTSVVLARLMGAAGLPAGTVNVVAGLGPSAGARLVTHPKIGKIVFVGSPETGKRIAAAAAGQLIPCVLELGGKSANIVFDDADLERAVVGAAAAIFSGAGQSCVSGSRLLVQRGAYDLVVTRLGELADRIRVGHPLKAETQVGPLQNRRQFERVTSLVRASTSSGAEEITGRGRENSAFTGEGFFYRPTVLAGVRNRDSIAQEEVFGPVVVAMPFDDEEEAVRLANDTTFGLAGAVWTSAVDRAHNVARQIRAGTVWVNGYKTISVMSPFGGWGSSGYGRSSGLDGLMEYSQPKSVWIETDADAPLAFGY